MFCLFLFLFPGIFLFKFAVAGKKMPYFLFWVPRVAADSKTSRSLRCRSGAAFFTNNNTICTLFHLFLFFVYLVASINKLELILRAILFIDGHLKEAILINTPLSLKTNV